MGRSKHITPEKRRQIQLLRNEGLKLKDISERVNISVNACHQALKHMKANGSSENKVRAERPRKTTERLDRMIHRLSEANRHMTAVDVLNEISNQTNVNIGVHTVRRRLNEFGLMGRVARKKPLISKKTKKSDSPSP
jgi:transposase